MIVVPGEVVSLFLSELISGSYLARHTLGIFYAHYDTAMVRLRPERETLR